MIYLVYLVILVAIFLFYKVLNPEEKERISIYQKLKGERGEKHRANFVLRLFSPLNNPLLKKAGLYEKIEQKLSLAKIFWAPGEFFALKELLVIFILLIVYLFNFNKPLIVTGAIAFSFILPDLWLIQKIKQRKESIARVLPETVDLLSLCVGAGLDFMAAVRWVIEKTTPNPMIEELKYVLEEINIGKSRVQALRDMSKRLDTPDVTSFVRTLIQADRMGTPVEEAFVIISDDSRMRRKQRGRRQALKAPIKMLIPVIFCIMPVVMIIVAGPILIKFFSQNLFIFK
ncbi:MAG: type II secretion system F family protein [Candidatus Omnitrophica bacterium]|nr:type II secretion system F family protein [Candidatus Omnitrophota bacterium]